MDVGTGIALFGPSAITLKLLGPTADYIGEGVKDWVDLRRQNVNRIFDAAEYKIDLEQLDEPGAVPPRILKGVMDDGSFMEDEVGSEYFAGLLAASRSPEGNDDSSVPSVALIGRLSSFQLRAHFVLYRAAQAVAAAQPEINLHLREGRVKLHELAVPTDAFYDAVRIPESTGMNSTGAMAHVMIGLQQHDLIDAPGWYCGDSDFLLKQHRVEWSHDHMLVFHLSNAGIALFCAAHGYTASPWDDFKRPTAEFARRFRATIPPCEAVVVGDLPPCTEADG